MDTITAMDLLASTWPELQQKWNTYINRTYATEKDRLVYIDICEITSFIIDKLLKDDTTDFSTFFTRVEKALNQGDESTQNLMVVGLIEGLQNMCADNYNYYTGFDQWLQPKTKKCWDEVIHFWESEESKRKWDEIQRKVN